MIRLGVSVEGATEREFVQRVISPHLAAFNVTATPIDMRGRVSLDRIAHEITPLIYSFDRVTTFYDYYGFRKREGRTVETLEEAMAGLAPQGRRHLFIPYIQCYEFEALVLAAPEAAEAHLRAPGLAGKLTEIRNRCGGAEWVNDGRDTCPSRRIQEAAPRYDKKLHGPLIIASAGLASVRSEAPRFDSWLSRIEALGDAGDG